MRQRSPAVGRTTRVLRSLSLSAIVVLGVTACGGDESSGTAASATSDTNKAASTLEAGLEAHASGDLTAASASYQKTLDLDPANKFALYNLALIDEARSNYGLAEQKYRAALKSDPAYEPALFNLAILRTGPDPKEATSLYQRAVESNPQDAAAWLNLGLLQRAAGQKDAGNASVLKAVALDPELKDPAQR